MNYGSGERSRERKVYGAYLEKGRRVTNRRKQINRLETSLTTKGTRNAMAWSCKNNITTNRAKAEALMNGRGP